MANRGSSREHPILAVRPGQTPLLLGNHAIVRGALEAGVAVATAYPGTPSSEIADTFHELADQAGIYFEYSTNEKVALEVGAGAAYSGARTLVSMKHVGLNVALEPLMSLAYTGVPAGMVIVTADDPGCHSSQNEQDNRLLARFANLPCLEPATAEEARRLTKFAFDLSERFELPVLLRTTTRISHTRGVVEVEARLEPRLPGGFERDFRRYVTMPPISLQRHGVLLEAMEAVARAVDELDECVVDNGVDGSVGIVSTGVCRNYVHDALLSFGLADEVRHLEIVATHPLPRDKCLQFLSDVDRVLVVEELEPVVEDALHRWKGRHNPEVRIEGKGFAELSRHGEYTPDAVGHAIARFLDRPTPLRPPAEAKGHPPEELPARPPALCAGCPHRASYYALKVLAGDDAIFAGDIGCYTLGALPPFQMQDTLLCMGASTACAGGLAATNEAKVVATIGDSTFFHSGIAGLVNALRNGHDYTLAIFDNSTTAMTGHQPHPASEGIDRGQAVSIESVVRGLGVEKLEVVDPMDLPSITETARECIDHPGVAVLICREPCPLHKIKVEGPPQEQVVYRVVQGLCKTCGFKDQGLHCGTDICSSTELWRSKRKIEDLAIRGETPVRMRVPPCGAACPVNICVHGYVANIAAGDYAAALQAIRERNPLPSVCSRVCHQPCEDACYRSDFEGPVRINRLKRFVCDWATENADQVATPKIEEKHGEKVAVVGSGPAGLACAHDLALRGYGVTVFDQMPAPGGLLRYGIPPYRLPADVLDRDLDWISELGVEFRCGVTVGVDVGLDELAEEGFQAFFLATGAWTPRIPENLRDQGPQVQDALSFLREVNRGHQTGAPPEETRGKRVVVIGGGNTGIDTARSSRRLGGTSITIIERCTRRNCSAIPEEIEAAMTEGIEFYFDASLTRVVGDDDGLRGVEISVSGDDPIFIEADVAFVATGQKLDERVNWSDALVGTDSWFTVYDADGTTALPGVFAAGDAVDGPGNVIDVIAAGKRAAHGIDAYLAGDERPVTPLNFHDQQAYADQEVFKPTGVDYSPSVEPPSKGSHAAYTFEAPEGTFSDKQARAEAERCLACGACANCNVCIDHFACVAIYRDEQGQVRINPTLCNGCGVCADLCPNNAFEKVVLQEGR